MARTSSTPLARAGRRPTVSGTSRNSATSPTVGPTSTAASRSPTFAVRVELTAPTGGVWRFGPDDPAESVVGPAEDFCLVVTQRRHVNDTDLHVTGEAARDWMLKAQAFAGTPTDGPNPP